MCFLYPLTSKSWDRLHRGIALRASAGSADGAHVQPDPRPADKAVDAGLGFRHRALVSPGISTDWVGAAFDLINLHPQRGTNLVKGAEVGQSFNKRIGSIAAIQQFVDDQREQTTSHLRPGMPMCNRRSAMDAIEHLFGRAVRETQGNWDYAHERTVAITELVIAARQFRPHAAGHARERPRGSAADVEHFAVRRPQLLVIPADESLAHVFGVEIMVKQAVCGTQQERGVVRPGAS